MKTASMATDPRPPWQRRLEARVAAFAGTTLDPDRTVAEQCGALDTWIVEAGPTHLLLNPVSMRWLHFDKIHQSWEDTGFFAGQVVFFVEDGLLDARAIRAEEKGVWSLPLEHWRISNLRGAGALDAKQAAEQLEQLRWQDDQGTWWSLTVDDASWLRWADDTWQPSDPPSGLDRPVD